MLYMFKDLKIKLTTTYIVLSAALIAIIFYFLVNEMILSIGLSSFIFSFVILLSSIIFNITAQKRFKRITDILNEECDPYRYIEQLLPFTRQKLPADTKAKLFICLACGYINAGDKAQAMCVLSEFNKIHSVDIFIMADASNLWAAIYLDDKNLNNAQLALADLRKYLNQIKSRRASYKIVELYNRHTAKFNMLLNNLYGVEETYKLQLKNEQTLLEKNILYYEYASLCIKQNRIAEAKQMLGFVAANGNKLHIATEAREKLAQL